MKKKMLILIFMLFITSFFISPNIVLADNLNNTTNPSYNMVLLKGDNDSSNNGDDAAIEENESDDQVCEGLLGPLKEDLKFILNIIKIIGPILVVVFTTYELFAAVASNDDDALKNVMKSLITRIILVAILFFLPIILNLILGFVDNNYSTCIS